MSDRAAIDIRSLSKIYRLYRKPGHRFIDLFGLAPSRMLQFKEHPALNDITFRVAHGEKVAIIGRNGAGKSTLLKIIGSVVQPSSGTIQIDGELNALLSLGTGFHQDFTGRENVAAYLSQLGMSGREIAVAIPSIVDFAEIEDYIDQPLKTYSTGMQMRLAFAVSTSITPNILIIDEVLSVGDAYFVSKSYERISAMCKRMGTTLIMVTHDLHAAATICDRGVWLDRGHIQVDGPIRNVIAAYEDSIKQQEERRLRIRRREALKQNQLKGSTVWFGAIIPDGPDEISSDIAVAGIRIGIGKTEIPIDFEAVDPSPSSVITSSREGCWGELRTIQNRPAREFRAHASIFRSLPFYFEYDGELSVDQIVLDLDYISSAEMPIRVELRLASSLKPSAVAHAVLYATEWQTARVCFAPPSLVEATVSRPLSRRYGRHRMEITNVEFLDADGYECHQFEVGGTFRARLHYRLNDESFDEKPTIIIAFLKGGTLRTHRLFTEDLHLSASEKTTGTIEIVADPICFGPGAYLLNVSVFAEGFMNRPGEKRYFTINEELYDMHSRAYEIIVLDDKKKFLHNDSVLIHDSIWKHEA